MIVTKRARTRKPLYLLAPGCSNSTPLVPLLENTGLGIALITMPDRLLGLQRGYEMVPDLPNFVRMLATSINELAAGGRGGTRTSAY